MTKHTYLIFNSGTDNCDVFIKISVIGLNFGQDFCTAPYIFATQIFPTYQPLSAKVELEVAYKLEKEQRWKKGQLDQNLKKQFLLFAL